MTRTIYRVHITLVEITQEDEGGFDSAKGEVWKDCDSPVEIADQHREFIGANSREDAEAVYRHKTGDYDG